VTGLETKPLMRVLAGEPVWPPPIWIMRQAGRYLPEYRELRAEAGSFLDLCYNPRLAAEVTLQPIRRFGFDAAILFSDILVIPHALGQGVRFVEGEGPRLDPVTSRSELARLAPVLPLDRLAPVLETVRQVKAALPAGTALLGFCGAPWTVATYMIAGRGTPDQAPALKVAQQDPAFMAELIARLVESSITYLAAQLSAGADAVQIFESHAGALDPHPELFRSLSLEPMRRIAEGVRALHPGARIIVFPRGARNGLSEAAQAGFADAIGLDQDLDLAATLKTLPGNLATQGNLDPMLLIEGGAALDRGVDRVLDAVQGRPHIFNLGHGITPPTPPENVARLIARIRASRA
jgi:uroporphyrinogen decarboxylase